MSLFANAFSTVFFVGVYHGINHCPYMKQKFNSWNRLAHKLAQNPPTFD